jgi:hypothetical protein
MVRQGKYSNARSSSSSVASSRRRRAGKRARSSSRGSSRGGTQPPPPTPQQSPAVARDIELDGEELGFLQEEGQDQGKEQSGRGKCHMDLDLEFKVLKHFVFPSLGPGSVQVQFQNLHGPGVFTLVTPTGERVEFLPPPKGFPFKFGSDDDGIKPEVIDPSLSLETVGGLQEQITYLRRRIMHPLLVRNTFTSRVLQPLPLSLSRAQFSMDLRVRSLHSLYNIHLR